MLCVEAALIASIQYKTMRLVCGAGLAVLATSGTLRAADLRAPSGADADWYTGARAQAVDDSWAVAVDGSTSVTSNSSAFG